MRGIEGLEKSAKHWSPSLSFPTERKDGFETREKTGLLATAYTCRRDAEVKKRRE